MKMISYEEIIENWSNPKWDKWFDVEEILDSIGFTRLKKYDDPRQKLVGFVKNYLIEKSFIEAYPDYEYYSEDDLHEYLHEGPGNNTPDFKLKTQYAEYTAELKSVNFLGKFIFEPKFKHWHDAQIKLVFNRNDQCVYKINKDENFIWMDRFELDERYEQIQLQSLML